MSVLIAPRPVLPARHRLDRWGLLSALDRPGQLLEHLTPNWYASIMGTGIVANATAALPVQSTGLRLFALVVWAVAGAALVALTLAFVAHWTRHRATARHYADHPVMSQFYGAPAMALLTVGAGSLLLGGRVLGAGPALAVDAVLWTAGTVLGLATSMWVPFRMITAHDHDRTVALPAWLMPVVPPMVSASTGALLLPHLPAGQVRLALLLALYAMFGLSLLIGLVTITLVYGRLVHGGPPPVQAAPTVWITLGMIGQSITAANLLGSQAAVVVDARTAFGLHVAGLLYGAVMLGFGVLVFSLATALTVHAARRGLRFSLTWWSFTFPVGTCVTGTAALGRAAGSTAVAGLSIGLYAVLLVAWAVVATHTLRASRTGTVFLPA